jgi:16S rRNA G966 N2-methylase RsmD
MAAAQDVMDMHIDDLIKMKKNIKEKTPLIQYTDASRKFQVASLFPGEVSDAAVKGTPFFALRASPEGLYSVSRPTVSQKILDEIKKQYIKEYGSFQGIRIMDATANNGGDTIRFGLDEDVSEVISVEMNPQNFKILQHNVRLYKTLRDANKIRLFEGNMLDYIDKYDYDILYVDPPWGGNERVWKDDLTLHLALEKDYSSENEVFHTIASNTGRWKLCAVKVPATMPDEWILQQVHGAFGPFETNVVTINSASDSKCGVKLVLITKPRRGGRKTRRKRKRVRRKIKTIRYV